MLTLATTHTKDAVKQNTPQQRALFAEIRNAERSYGVQLRKVAKHIDDLIKGMHPYDANTIDTLRRMLELYSQTLKPWATAVSKRMLADVANRDQRAWTLHTKAMGYEMRREVFSTPIGLRFQDLMESQVKLITSLPLEASQRVFDIATGNMFKGARAADLAKHIMDTGNVTRARANLIARTTTSTAATSITQARAEFIGSPGYVWTSAEDYLVRPEIGIKHFAQLNKLAMGSHRKLNGTFHGWNDPPIADPTGIRAHPGQIWNCRCYPSPVLPVGI